MNKEFPFYISGSTAVVIVIILFPSQSRYLALQALLLRVQCLKACYLGWLRLRYAAKLFMLYTKWSKLLLHLHYLLLYRFIVHKWNGTIKR
jgi:hypothetical protein